MDRAGSTISDATMVDGAGRSPCTGLTFTENAIIDPGNTIILNGRIAILICSLYEQCHSFVVRKKGSYHKNKPFRLLAVAALFFVQSYLNDIAHRGSITTHLYKERPAANGCRPENFIFFHCPLDGVRFSETFRYYRLMHVYTRICLTLTTRLHVAQQIWQNCDARQFNQNCRASHLDIYFYLFVQFLYRNVTICARVQALPGAKDVSLTPLVTPLATAQRTASA